MGVKAPLGLRAQARLGSAQEAFLRRTLLLSLWQRVRSAADPLPLLSPQKGCQEQRHPSRPSGVNSSSRAFLAQHRDTPHSPWDLHWGQELRLGMAEQGSAPPHAPTGGSSMGGLALSFSWAWGERPQALGPPLGPCHPVPGPSSDTSECPVGSGAAWEPSEDTADLIFPTHSWIQP